MTITGAAWRTVGVGAMLGSVNVTVPSPSSAAERPERVPPLLLAAVVSVVAAVFAVVGNLVLGIGEAPLVIGTLIVASVVGWANLPSSTDRRRSH